MHLRAESAHGGVVDFVYLTIRVHFIHADDCVVRKHVRRRVREVIGIHAHLVIKEDMRRQQEWISVRVFVKRDVERLGSPVEVAHKDVRVSLAVVVRIL